MFSNQRDAVRVPVFGWVSGPTRPPRHRRALVRAGYRRQAGIRSPYRVLNLSASGVCIALADTLTVGQRLTLDLKLTRPLQARAHKLVGEVVWVRGERFRRLAGIRFVEQDIARDLQLSHLVCEIQLRQLRLRATSPLS